MKVIAKRIVIDRTENDIRAFEKLFEVHRGETVEDLMVRLDIDGKTSWHFDEAEIILKLVKE